uniref:Uncharacterized protein n=1 Tax=Anguilla anguilla TaxID=7936 RepID=A0A0E9TEX1_ANGAN
MSCFPQCFYFV